MNSKVLMLSVLLVILVVQVSSNPLNSIRKIPDYLKICHRKDPKLNDCIRESIEGLRPKLAAGIEELLVPPCEPLSIPEISIRQNAGAIRMDSEYSNILVSGLTNFTLRSIRMDPETNKFRIKLWFPSLAMVSDYNIHGKLLLMPLAGSGTCKGNFTDIDAIVAMKADVTKINEKDHLKVGQIFVEFNIGGASVELENLFNGDAELGSAMNKFLNENWKEVTAEMRPALSSAIENILRGITSRLFDSFPTDQLLPA